MIEFFIVIMYETTAILSSEIPDTWNGDESINIENRKQRKVGIFPHINMERLQQESLSHRVCCRF